MIERIILVLWALAAAGYDARRRRLPNWLTLGGLAVGAVYAFLTGTSLLGGDAVSALLAAVVGLAALFPAYLAGWMGAGDVKLFAAMGMLGGGKVLLPTLLAGSLITGFGALVLIWLNRGIVPRKRLLPFGVGLAAGFVLSVLDLLPILAWKG
ncbi:MAG TPA: prepilin peptidase [Gallionella sp.]|nr:prepilin peptidase [Gallionella sp.]